MTPWVQLYPSSGCRCDRYDASAWLNDVTELALSGDEDARRMLPAVVEHFLRRVKRP